MSASGPGVDTHEMVSFLHTHHTGEDELLFPLLRERAALDPQLMNRMDAQHEQVNDAVAAIDAELPAWTASADRPYPASSADYATANSQPIQRRIR